MSTELSWGGNTSSDERNMALLSHLSCFVLPVIGPLILWLIKKDSSRFVAYHAIQALIFQLLASVVSGATCGLGLVLLILPIVWGIKASKGEWAGYPLIESVGR